MPPSPTSNDGGSRRGGSAKVRRRASINDPRDCHESRSDKNDPDAEPHIRRRGASAAFRRRVSYGEGPIISAVNKLGMTLDEEETASLAGRPARRSSCSDRRRRSVGNATATNPASSGKATSSKSARSRRSSLSNTVTSSHSLRSQSSTISDATGTTARTSDSKKSRRSSLPYSQQRSLLREKFKRRDSSSSSGDSNESSGKGEFNSPTPASRGNDRPQQQDNKAFAAFIESQNEEKAALLALFQAKPQGGNPPHSSSSPVEDTLKVHYNRSSKSDKVPTTNKPSPELERHREQVRESERREELTSTGMSLDEHKARLVKKYGTGTSRTTNPRANPRNLSKTTPTPTSTHITTGSSNNELKDKLTDDADDAILSRFLLGISRSIEGLESEIDGDAGQKASMPNIRTRSTAA